VIVVYEIIGLALRQQLPEILGKAKPGDVVLVESASVKNLAGHLLEQYRPGVAVEIKIGHLCPGCPKCDFKGDHFLL